MIIEPKNGGLLIYELVRGEFVKQFYVGYSKREAVREFRAYAREVRT